MPAQSKSDLVGQLKNADFRKLSQDYFSIRSLSYPRAILAAVDKSTIRAYHRTKLYTPSSLYRSWAWAEVSSTWSERLAAASHGVHAYREFHVTLCERLQLHWKIFDEAPVSVEEKCEPLRWSVPNYGRTRKLVDLFMKHVLLVADLDADLSKRLRQLVHVPLDKYTLKHLSGVSRQEKAISLPTSKWTMGTANLENYLPLQDLIRDVTFAAHAAPIDFDIYAWNAEHSQVTQDFIRRWSSSPSDDVTERESQEKRMTLVRRTSRNQRDFKWLGRQRREEKLAQLNLSAK